MSRRGVMAVVVAVAWSRPVAAEPDPSIGHETVNLQRFDASSRVGIDTARITRFSDSTIWRFELHGQYVETTTRLGGYVQVSDTYLRQRHDSFVGQHSKVVSPGHVELGALWAPRLAIPIGIVLHAGIAIPIKDDDHDTALLGMLLRPHDMYDVWPDVENLRAGVSVLARREYLFARFDAGLDVNLATTPLVPTQVVGVHANAGVGIHAPNNLSVALELSTITLDVDDLYFLNTTVQGTTLLASGGMSVRYQRGPAEIYAAVIAPMRELQRDQIRGGGVTFGIEWNLP